MLVFQKTWCTYLMDGPLLACYFLAFHLKFFDFLMNVVHVGEILRIIPNETLAFVT